MKRWINSALITLLVLVLAFSLPLWAELPQNHSETQDGLFNEEIEKVTAATVALLQQRVKATPVTKTVPPNAPTVPARQDPQEIPPPVAPTTEAHPRATVIIIAFSGSFSQKTAIIAA